MKNIFKSIGFSCSILVIGIVLSLLYSSDVIPLLGVVVIGLVLCVLVFKLFQYPINIFKKAAPKTTLYQKERVVQKGSKADQLSNVFIASMGIVGICLVVAEAYGAGLICGLIAFILLKKKIDRSKIDSFEKIVTPGHWPRDCQYADYNQGLQAKSRIAFASKEAQFYRRCRGEGIENLDRAQEMQKALLIAQVMKRKDLSAEAIRNAFEAGKLFEKKSAAEEKAFDREQKLSEVRIKELKVLEGAMKYYGIHGKEKRIVMLRDLYEEAKKEMKEAEARKHMSRSMLLQKEHDWAVHGGIASAIAGPAAGLVTAMEVEAKNAAIREYNAQMTPYVTMLTSACNDEVEMCRNQMKQCKEDMEKTATKLVSDDAVDKVFGQLCISKTKYAISETGAVVVEADFSVNENYRIFDDIKPAIDGTVAARLLENGKYVGSAYFVLPVEGVHHKVRLASICTKTTDVNASYEIKFEPIKLWAMEQI